MEPHGSTGSPAQGASADWRDDVDARLFGVRLLGGRYAFAAPLVTEVVRLGPLTRIPAAPSFLRGVFTHRGEVLPVLDVAQLAGHGPIPVGVATRAAIVRSGPWIVALIVEAVEGLVEIGKDQLEPPLTDGSGISAFLAAVGRDERGPFAVIDLPRLVETARARSMPA